MKSDENNALKNDLDDIISLFDIGIYKSGYVTQKGKRLARDEILDLVYGELLKFQNKLNSNQ